MPEVSEHQVNEHMYASCVEVNPVQMSGVSVAEETLDIGAEVSFSTSPPPPDAVVIVEPEHGTSSSTHHVGPIGESYIMEKRARQKSFSKRLKTFQKTAHLLNTMCGAFLKYTIIAESGRIISASHPPTTVRSVGLQSGQPADAPATRKKVVTVGTPRKTPAKLAKKITNMPGKKEKNVPAVQKRIVNKCAYCGVIFNSVKDKLFRKKHRLQAEWLGCEAEGCAFWGHAVCANVFIKSRKDIPSIQLHSKHP